MPQPYTPPTVQFSANRLGTLMEPSSLDAYLYGYSVLNPAFPYVSPPYDAWCLNAGLPFTPGTIYTASLYSSYELGILADGVPTFSGNAYALGNLDSINYLLNYYDGTQISAVDLQPYTYGEIQAAIWQLLGQDWHTQPAYVGPVNQVDIDALVQLGLDNSGYVPGDGRVGDHQKIGLILDPIQNGVHLQPVIIETEAARLGDFVWNDVNANGVQDSGSEVGIAGAVVNLVRDLNSDGDFNDANELLASTTTDLNGNYAFNGLTPGLDYQVQFVMPAGYNTASPRQADADAFSGSNSDGLVSDVVVLSPGEYNATLDAGFYNVATAALGDRIWVDTNANGQQDDGATGLNGLTVTLIGGGTDGLINGIGDTTATTTTAGDGNYAFTGLTPGVQYQVQFSKPATTVYTGKDIGSDSSDSDADLLSGKTQIVTLASGENNTTLDAGVYTPASIGDKVFEDKNGNGQQDGGENGIPNATVELYTCVGGVQGAFVASTTTNASGIYSFTGLKPGDYIVQFITPGGGYTQTTANVGADASDSDAGLGGLTACYTLNSGDNNTTVDAGFYKTAALGDRIWVDTNANGQQDDGATGLNGLTVTLIGGGTDGLINGIGDTTATTTTAGDGNYAFTGLTPGVQYQVQFSKPAGYGYTTQDVSGNTLDSIDSDANTSTGKSQIVTLVSGENNTTVDAGVTAVVRIDIEKYVHGEYLVQGAGGGEGLTPGFWKNHSAYGPAPLSGWPETGLSPDASYEAIFGVDVPASAPTLLQALGTGGGGVDALLRHSTAALLNAANPYVDYAYTQAQIISMVQAAFVSGDYETPKNLFASQNELGADLNTPATTGSTLVITPDVDADTAGSGPIIPVGGTAVFTYVVKNTGSVELSNIAVADDRIATLTFVGGDTDGDGRLDVTETWTYKATETVLTGTAYVNIGTVTGRDATSGTTVTDNDAANYTTSSLGQTLGDRVWLDSNANGIQDLGEAGIGGVTVQLKNTGGTILQTATTDANGNYLFDLAVGSYVVTVLTPAGYVVSPKDKGGNDNTDSDIDTVTKTTGTVTIAAGQQNLTVDAGLYQTAGLGDRIWIDSNGDGKQTTAEIGVNGLTVTLIGGGTDGLINGIGDTTATTTTAGDGNYAFTGLTPGVQYQVQFSKPAGSVYTTKDVGLNGSDMIDSDADTVTGKSQIVTLVSGENNTTIDAGVRVNGDLSITKTDGLTTVTAGQAITYTIVASNSGPADALNAVVSDTMPANLTGVTWTSVASGGASANQLSGSGNILDTVNLPSGSSITYTVSGTAAATTLSSHSADFGAATNNTNLGQNVTINGIRADAFYVSGTSLVSTNTVLWERNVTDDHGLGVWSNGEPDPIAGGGDVNEISNQLNNEVIRLTKGAAGEQWTSLWVSSLDAGGSGGAETGTFYWSNSATPNLSTLTTKFTFRYGDFGPNTAEGNVLSLNPTGFDANANYVFFVAGPNTAGTNNDYLLWQASTGAPTSTLVNTATVTAPAGFTDTNSGNNSATDTDTMTARASLGDLVWEDRNANGVQDDGDAGIAGVTIKLFNATGTQIGSTVTDASGLYNFDVAAGTYSVGVVSPAGYLVTTANVGSNDAIDSDISQTTGITAPVTVAAGQSNLTLDGGLYKTASIGDRVWFDLNENGIQDGGEAGVPNVTVNLLNASGNVAGTTLTNASGGYQFAGLTPGAYSVQFVPLAGYNFTAKDAGGNTAASDLTDSDADLVTGKTIQTVLVSGENDLSWDAGIAPICTTLTFDFSGNSALDGTDGNSRSWTVGGVTATAKAYSRDKTTGVWTTAWLGSYSGGLGVTDSGEGNGANDTHAVDNTGGRDNYILVQFSQTVEVDKTFLGYVAGDSDLQVWMGNSATPIASLSNSVLSGMAFSEVNTTTLSTARTVDINATGYSGNIFIIAADTTDTTPEDFFKVQTLTVCAPDVVTPVAKASIGNFVWEDKNYNGLQDSGEAGIANVTVKLLSSTGAVMATTTTDASGGYQFSNLTPANYRVQVVAPTGYFLTKANQGANDATDSDVDATGTTVLTTLSAGENDLSWDAGLYRKANVGDKVWEDRNHNGIQDNISGTSTPEPGIGGIKVALKTPGLDGIVGNADDASVGSTTTNASGSYGFGNLDPGSYYLQFDKSNVTYSGVNMNTWKWAVQNTGTNDAVDSDVAGDGVSTTNVTNTEKFTLVSGQNDLTRDAGLTPIVIDLDGNGIQTISRAHATAGFDLFGNGGSVKSGWISATDGFLAVDKNGNGKIDGIGELFGGTAQGAGFAQLAGFDSNSDGLVNDADTAFGQLMIWRDVNGNHATDAGELMTLAQAGVSSLTVGYNELPFLDGQGNLHLERSSATLSDGASVAMTDVYFNVSAEDAAAAGVQLPSMAELLGDQHALDSLLGSDGQSTVHDALAGAETVPCGSDAAEMLRRLAAQSQQDSHQLMAA